ncbi:MAG: citrate synthase, partial [Clostridia bacterium]|nr:citrate synthase [Clostridia bacterium]
MEYSKKISELATKAYDYYNIPFNSYSSLNLKRGLRNHDGTGVLAGLTRICEVHGYVMSEDEKTPIQGQLSYRGYDINDLTRNPGIDHRFGFEEIAYLLMFGNLPSDAELRSFCDCLAELRELPDYFAEDMIIKAPSRNVMNKMARSVLALYSYDDNPDSTDLENVMRQSLLLLARMPILAVYGYSAKVHHYDHKSLIMHNPKPQLSTAENLLRMLSSYKQFTPLEAEVLDTALMLHAEHGGGNNSTFSCRVLSSTGTDTYSAIASAICSLKGPKHGGANAQVIGMMDDLQDSVSDWTNENQVYDYLLKVVKKEAYDKSGLIY